MNTSTTPSIVAGRVTADDVTRALRALVPDTHRALLFGSRATGRARDRSARGYGSRDGRTERAAAAQFRCRARPVYARALGALSKALSSVD